MKKLKNGTRLYFKIISRKRFCRKQASKLKKTIKNQQKQSGHFAGISQLGKREAITAPTAIDVINPKFKDKTCLFFHRITESVVHHNRAIRIRFSSTNFISPSGALALYAYLDKAIRLSGRGSVITMSYPENEYVEAVLQQTGINALLNASNRKSATELRQLCAGKKVMDLKPVASDTSVNGQTAGQLLQSFRSLIPRGEIPAIYGGIMEAVTNCAQHAYLHDKNARNPLGKRWWMLMARDHKSALHILVCDLGIGIPVSFPKKFAAHWNKVISKIKANTTDTFVIQEAMKYAATRTRETNRGKGLADFKKPIDSVSDGLLHVLSNHGFYVYKSNGRGAGLDCAVSLCGTLIEWVLPIRDIKKASME